MRTSSVEQIIKEVSQYSFSIPYQSSWGLVSVSIQAELPVVRFEKLDKDMDLMVLWKHRKPSAKIQIDLRKVK